jgi:hypothetical protein
MGTHSQDEVYQMIKVKDSEIFAMVSTGSSFGWFIG